MLPFSVVVFSQEDTIEVISSSWLNDGKTETYWPSTVGNRLKKLVTTHANPLSEVKVKWGKYSCRILKSYDSFEAARKGCKKAEDNETSNIETTDVDTPIRSRKVKQKFRTPSLPIGATKVKKNLKPKAPSPSSSDTSDSSLELIDESPTNLRDLDTGYTPFLQQLADTSFGHPEDLYDNNNASSSTSDNSQIPLVTDRINQTGEQIVYAVEGVQPTISDVMNVLKEVQIAVGHQKEEAQRLQNFVITQMVLVKEKLNEILARTITTQSETLEVCRIGIPVKTLDELNSLQSFLLSDDNFMKLSKQLSVLGGGTPSKITHHILNEIISTEVALVISFTGKGTKAQAGLRKTPVINLLYETVRRTKGGVSTTNKEINEFVKVWLKNASDRDGGKKRRMSKQGQQQVPVVPPIQQVGSARATETLPAIHRVVPPPSSIIQASHHLVLNPM
ncbi:unnamed protein product [Orchesella dallaii]|uniref:DUF4806 domain-containing protein n=1 Tax=Orchesella dallaii TaxID=48710 RepID=A0ABP1S4A8_9HEXA